MQINQSCGRKKNTDKRIFAILAVDLRLDQDALNTKVSLLHWTFSAGNSRFAVKPPLNYKTISKISGWYFIFLLKLKPQQCFSVHDSLRVLYYILYIYFGTSRTFPKIYLKIKFYLFCDMTKLEFFASKSNVQCCSFKMVYTPIRICTRVSLNL